MRDEVVCLVCSDTHGARLRVFRDRVPKMSPTTAAPQIKRTVKEHGRTKPKTATLRVPYSPRFAKELWEHANWLLELVCPFVGQVQNLSPVCVPVLAARICMLRNRQSPSESV